MKLWAKVRFRGERNAEYLIRAFFKEFNPESSIEIKGNEAKVSIIFTESPTAIVDAISFCEIIEFKYGTVPCNQEEWEEKCSDQEEVASEETSMQDGQEEVVSEETAMQDGQEEVLSEETAMQDNQEDVSSEETAMQDNQEDVSSEETAMQDNQEEVVSEENAMQDEQEEVASEETSMQDAQEEEVSEKSTYAENAKEIEQGKEKSNQIEKLVQFAEESTSYDDFTKKVVEWLDLNKKQKYFEKLIKVAEKLEKISWKNLEEVLEGEDYSYSQGDRLYCTKQIATRFNNCGESVTILKLIKAIVEYKAFDFNNEVRESSKEIIAEEEVEQPKRRVRMECMPEIPSFEEVLGSVDKSQSVEDRVRYVLIAMGIKNKDSKEQKMIFEIVNTAVRLSRIAFDIIFLKINIPMTATKNARMTLSTFINDFAKKYSPNDNIKVLDFIKDLQKVIMFDDEIEDFGDIEDFENVNG